MRRSLYFFLGHRQVLLHLRPAMPHEGIHLHQSVGNLLQTLASPRERLQLLQDEDHHLLRVELVAPPYHPQ